MLNRLREGKQQMPQQEKQEPKMICDAEFVLPCKKHDQMKADPSLVTEDSRRLVAGWLSEHECPSGMYRVVILRRMNPRKLSGKTFGHLRLNARRNTVEAMINFGGQDDCRRVELIPPEGAKAELVCYLLSGQSATLKYHRETKQKIETIFLMMLWALRRALVTGDFTIFVGNVLKVVGDYPEGSISITEHALDHLTFVVRPGSEQPYPVRLSWQNEMVNPFWIALKLIDKAEIQDHVYANKRPDMKELKAKEAKVREQAENIIKTCRRACYEMLGDESFPAATEKLAKRCYDRACHEYREKHNFSEFKERWLDRVGNFYCPKAHFFEWLASAIRDEDVAVPDRIAEAAASIQLQVRNMDAEMEQWQATQESDLAEVERLAAEILGLELKLREATQQLQALKEKRRKERENPSREHLEARLSAYHALMEGAFGKLAANLEKKRERQRAG